MCSHLFLLHELTHEGAANSPRPYNAHCQGQGGKIEAAVNCPQGTHTVLAIYQDCDVVLAAPLSNGPADSKKTLRYIHISPQAGMRWCACCCCG